MNSNAEQGRRPRRPLRGLQLAAALLLCAALACQSGDHPRTLRYGPEAAHVASPTPIPDHIILTWNGNPATTTAVTWRTDSSVREAFAEIAVAEAAPDFHRRAARITAETTPLRTTGGEACYHEVTFRNLAPNTLYAYRVGSTESSSEWFHFRTADREPAPFAFIYLGDAQNNILAMWSRAIRAAYAAAPEARFILHAGDLVGRGDSDRDWDGWFRAGGWILATVPSIPVIGNHEYYVRGDGDDRLPPLWPAQFALPANGLPELQETSYYIDCQGLRIIALNSRERVEEQTPWLEQVLRENPNHWTIASFHHPVYSATSGRDNAELRGLWQPLFERYHVALVLQGHDHTYARGRNLPGAGSGGGPVYVVSVSGPKMYDLPEERWMDRCAENLQLFQIITVEREILRYEARTVTGEIFDAFELVRRPDGSAMLIETS
jgi:hypothetical protein